MNFKKINSLIIYLTPIVIFLLLFSNINTDMFIKNFKKINIVLLFISIVIFIFNHLFISTLQWLKTLLMLGYSFSFIDAMSIRIGSYPIKAIFPFKSGDLIRALYLKKCKNIPFFIGVSSLYINIIINFLVLLIIMMLNYIFFCANLLYISLFSLGLLLIFLILFFKKFIIYFINKISPKLKSPILSFFNIYSRFTIKDLFVLLLYSFIIWSCELIIFFILFRAAGLSVPFYAIMVFVPLTILISNIPVTISGLGIREMSIIFYFMSFGSSEKLLMAGTLISFVNFFIPLLLSLFFIKDFFNDLLKFSSFHEKKNLFLEGFRQNENLF